jgi:hypothetical protein
MAELSASEASPNAAELSSLSRGQLHVLTCDLHLDRGGLAAGGLTSRSGRVCNVEHRIVNHSAGRGRRGLSFAGLFQSLVEAHHKCLSLEEGHVGSLEDGDNGSISDLGLQPSFVRAEHGAISTRHIGEGQGLIELVVVLFDQGLLANRMVHDSIHRLFRLMRVGPSGLKVSDEVVEVQQVLWDQEIIVVTKELVSPLGRVSFAELESPSHFRFRIWEWSDLDVVAALLDEVTGGSSGLAQELAGEFGLRGSGDRGGWWWGWTRRCGCGDKLLSCSHVC